MIQRLSDLAMLLPQSADRAWMFIGGSLGGVLSFAFGDAGPLLTWLVIFVVLDFFTGTLAAILTGIWSSRRNMLGVLKKVFVFCVCALAHGLDVLFSDLLNIQIIQSIVICAYAAGEFGSIIENLERMGFKNVVPPVVKKLIDALNARLDRTVDKVTDTHEGKNADSRFEK